MNEESNGLVQNCRLMPRIGNEPIFIIRADGIIVPNLDGYVVMPCEEFDKLR